MLPGPGDFLPRHRSYGPCDCCEGEVHVDELEWDDIYKGHVCVKCAAELAESRAEDLITTEIGE